MRGSMPAAQNSPLPLRERATSVARGEGGRSVSSNKPTPLTPTLSLKGEREDCAK